MLGRPQAAPPAPYSLAAVLRHTPKRLGCQRADRPVVPRRRPAHGGGGGGGGGGVAVQALRTATAATMAVPGRCAAGGRGPAVTGPASVASAAAGETRPGRGAAPAPCYTPHAADPATVPPAGPRRARPAASPGPPTPRVAARLSAQRALTPAPSRCLRPPAEIIAACAAGSPAGTPGGLGLGGGRCNTAITVLDSSDSAVLGARVGRVRSVRPLCRRAPVRRPRPHNRASRRAVRSSPHTGLPASHAARE